jgi:hypothetical protein
MAFSTASAPVFERKTVSIVVTGHVGESLHQPRRAGDLGVCVRACASPDRNVLAGDVQRVHEVELGEWVENLGVVVAKRHRANVAREVHEDVAVRVGTEGPMAGAAWSQTNS